ncbi:MAG: phosphatase PAP2 family protein [Prosthecochloris sp.]|nr:phosphatase PAP2 family protein [Prosthecochloris sp.]
MDVLQQADAWIFQLLNLNLVHPAADDLMVFLSRPELSGHMMLLAALFMMVRRGWNGVIILLLTLLAVGCADWVASGVLKPFFQRTRPCFELEECRLLLSQTRSYSFASSHAATTAAIAGTIYIFFSRGELVDRAYTAVMVLYALLVSYSRVYVGVHYPGDVIAGAVIGIVSSGIVYTCFTWIVKNVVHTGVLKR